MTEREIKFRAINTKLPRCWIYGYFVKDGDNCYIINKDDTYPVIAGTQSQFIGIHDKHGKMIYEGDIVKSGKWVAEVPSIDKFIEFAMSMYEMADYSDAEIIGNVHESPELLVNGE